MDTPLVGYSSSANTPSTSATNYIWLDSQNSTWNATETARNAVIAIAGTISKLYVLHQTAPGGAASYAYTIMKNGVATALTCTVSAAGTTAVDTSNSFSVVAGDLLSLRAVPSSTPTAPGNLTWTTMFTGGVGESVLMGGTNGAISNTVTNYGSMQAFSNAANWNATEVNVSSVMPTAGVIKNLQVYSPVAPAAGKSYAYTIMKNGSTTAVTCTMANTATTASDTSNTVTYAAGDTISIQAVPTGTPTAATPRFSVQWAPTTDGESLLLFGSSTNMLNAGANYEVAAGLGLSSWTATEANRKIVLQTCTVKKLFVIASGTPGVATSYTISPRKNSASTSITAQIANLATTANDTSNTSSFTQGDTLGLESTPAGTPTARALQAGMVMYIAPPVVGATSSVSLLLGVG